VYQKPVTSDGALRNKRQTPFILVAALVLVALTPYFHSMKLLYLNYEYPPIGGGGGATTRFLAKEMASRGHSVYVLTAGLRGESNITVEMKGLTVERLDTGRYRPERCTKLEMVAYILKCWIRLPTLIKSIKPDTIHLFFSFPTGAAYWFYKHYYGSPYVVSLLGGDVPGFLPEETDIYHRLISPFTKSLWQRARAVVANSMGLQSLAESLAWCPISVIPNGVDLTVFRPNGVRPHKSDLLKLIFVGRLVPQKGLDVLVRALVRLDVMQIKYELTVVGEGEQKTEYKLLADNLGVGKNVKWIGWISLEQLATIYREHDALVLPSRFEGLASVTLQGLASGCVVVSSNVFGARDVLVDGVNGFVVEKDNDAVLAQAIAKLLDAHRLTTMRQAAIASASRYAWDIVASRYEQVYSGEV
jgi:glycosyltransferase involved in cell wall biosynthesis